MRPTHPAGSPAGMPATPLPPPPRTTAGVPPEIALDAVGPVLETVLQNLTAVGAGAADKESAVWRGAAAVVMCREVLAGQSRCLPSHPPCAPLLGCCSQLNLSSLNTARHLPAAAAAQEYEKRLLAKDQEFKLGQEAQVGWGCHGVLGTGSVMLQGLASMLCTGSKHSRSSTRTPAVATLCTPQQERMKRDSARLKQEVSHWKEQAANVQYLPAPGMTGAGPWGGRLAAEPTA